MSTFIIAEAGINHNGNIDTAYKLVDAACDAKADAVKFQTFWGLTNHPTLTDEELHGLELTKSEWRQLKDYCDKVEIEFMSTPDTIDAAWFLRDLGMAKWKIGSAFVRNVGFLGAILVICQDLDAKRISPEIFMSTGMCNQKEVVSSLAVLGWSKIDNLVATVFYPIWVLHCVSEYPCPYDKMNLGTMRRLERLGVPYGLSDHTLGIEIPIAAVALGASVIEKHFTLDKSMKGPDHSWALDPKELTEMVRCIRNVELALAYYDIGNGPTPKELELRAQLENMREFA